MNPNKNNKNDMNYKNDKLEGKWTHWYSYPGLSVSEENSERKQWEEALLGILIYEQAEISYGDFLGCLKPMPFF